MKISFDYCILRGGSIWNYCCAFGWTSLIRCCTVVFCESLCAYSLQQLQLRATYEFISVNMNNIAYWAKWRGTRKYSYIRQTPEDQAHVLKMSFLARVEAGRQLSFKCSHQTGSLPPSYNVIEVSGLRPWTFLPAKRSSWLVVKRLGHTCCCEPPSFRVYGWAMDLTRATGTRSLVQDRKTTASVDCSNQYYDLCLCFQWQKNLWSAMQVLTLGRSENALMNHFFALFFKAQTNSNR